MPRRKTDPSQPAPYPFLDDRRSAAPTWERAAAAPNLSSVTVFSNRRRETAPVAPA